MNDELDRIVGLMDSIRIRGYRKALEEVLPVLAHVAGLLEGKTPKLEILTYIVAVYNSIADRGGLPSFYKMREGKEAEG